MKEKDNNYIFHAFTLEKIKDIEKGIYIAQSIGDLVSTKGNRNSVAEWLTSGKNIKVLETDNVNNIFSIERLCSKSLLFYNSSYQVKDQNIILVGILLPQWFYSNIEEFKDLVKEETNKEHISEEEISNISNNIFQTLSNFWISKMPPSRQNEIDDKETVNLNLIAFNILKIDLLF